MKSSKGIALAGLLMLGLAFHTQLAQAQAAGTLDTTFGTAGTVTTTFTTTTLVPIGAVEQSSGDIVVVSQADFQADAGTNIGLTRFTAAGKLDKTFGKGGSIFTQFTNTELDPSFFAVLPNDEIIVAGGIEPIGSVVGGVDNFGLAKFTAGGALDTTFGTGGLVITPIGPRADVPEAFLLQPNGQIVMAGLEGGNGEKPTNPGFIPNMVSIARYNSNGTLDSTFGSDGVALLNIATTFEGAAQIALLANGDYLVIGEPFGSVLTAEVSSAGVLSSTFTDSSVVATSTCAHSALGTETVFEPNGNFLIAQTVATASHDRGQRVQLNQYSEAAVLDSSFDPALFSFSGTLASTTQALALTPNGQILVGGSLSETAAPFGGLTRLNANGALDTTFGTGGTVLAENPVNGLLVETSGNIVAVEGEEGAGQTNITLQRFLGN